MKRDDGPFSGTGEEADQIIDADRNFAGWMKSRPTWMRRLGAAAPALIILLAVLAIRRPDFHTYPQARMWTTIGVMAVLLAVSLVLALRPLHLPRLPDWVHRALTTVGVVVAFLLAAVPAGDAASAPTFGAKCFVIGLLLGVPVYAFARLFDRGANSFSAILAALASGLTGNLALHVHCPRIDATHLLSGHFTVVLAFVAVAAVLVWLEARFQAKSVLKGAAWPRRS
jgi:hypothetical protein